MVWDVIEENWDCYRRDVGLDALSGPFQFPKGAFKDSHSVSLSEFYFLGCCMSIVYENMYNCDINKYKTTQRPGIFKVPYLYNLCDFCMCL